MEKQQTTNIPVEEDTAEDDAMELLKEITNNVKLMMENEVVQKTFKYFTDKFDEEFSDNLISLLTVLTTSTAHMAIVSYDQILVQKLDKQISALDNNMLYLKAKQEAHDAVLEMQRKKIDEIVNQLKITDFKESNNV